MWPELYNVYLPLFIWYTYLFTYKRKVILALFLGFSDNASGRSFPTLSNLIQCAIIFHGCRRSRQLLILRVVRQNVISNAIGRTRFYLMVNANKVNQSRPVLDTSRSSQSVLYTSRVVVNVIASTHTSSKKSLGYDRYCSVSKKCRLVVV